MSGNRTGAVRQCTVLITYNCHISSFCIICCALKAVLAVTGIVKFLCFQLLLIQVNAVSFQLNKANAYLHTLVYNTQYLGYLIQLVLLDSRVRL